MVIIIIIIILLLPNKNCDFYCQPTNIFHYELELIFIPSYATTSIYAALSADDYHAKRCHPPAHAETTIPGMRLSSNSYLHGNKYIETPLGQQQRHTHPRLANIALINPHPLHPSMDCVLIEEGYKRSILMAWVFLFPCHSNLQRDGPVFVFLFVSSSFDRSLRTVVY